MLHSRQMSLRKRAHRAEIKALCLPILKVSLPGRKRENPNTRYPIKSHWTRAFVLASWCVASAVAAIPSANAEGKFDGTWTIELVTKTGPCDQSYLGDVQVIDGALHLASANSGTFSGRVTPSGAVTLTSTMGGGNGVGSGRVSGSSGSGSWHAETQNGACSGVWSARRN
jgi:hypothetical protein